MKKNNQKNIPKLRFPEFSGAWEEKRFKGVFDRVVRKNEENNDNVLTISAQYGLVNQKDFFNKSVSAQDVRGYYLLHKNDFAYNKSYSKGYPMGAIKRLTKYDKGVISTLYVCFNLKKNNSEEFFEQYFESGNQNREIHKIAQEGARNHGLLNMSVKEFFEDIRLAIPPKEEQQKIASFLSVVDQRVEGLKKKKELMEKYKKGVMQKIFNQEIRFKDENGKDFPEWEEKRLGEIGEVVGGGTPDTTKFDCWNGEINWFTPTEIKQKYVKNSLRKISSVGLQKSSARLLPKNSLLITTRATIGNISIATEECTTNQGFQSLIVNDKNDNQFIYYWILNNKKELLRRANGSTFPEISSREVKKLKIHIPQKKEQQKIRSFLSSLDEKIEKINQELTQSQKFKKGLLQGLFV